MANGVWETRLRCAIPEGSKEQHGLLVTADLDAARRSGLLRRPSTWSRRRGIQLDSSWSLAVGIMLPERHRLVARAEPACCRRWY